MAAAPPSLHDRFAGALSLSTLGDALGLPNESRGLKGEVSPWPDDPDAWRLPAADTFREPTSNPWNIWAPPDVTAGECGVVSDDTAIKIALIEPWLAAARSRGEAVDEDGFISWLKRRPPEAVAWREAMAAEQARQWLAMFNVASSGTVLCSGDDSPCFYRPGAPVCFGYFLYLEAAMLDAERPPEQVYQRFASFCRLDQGDGRAITGLIAAALSTATRGKADDNTTEMWWALFLIKLRDLRQLNAPLFNQLWWGLRVLGRDSRTASVPVFLRRVKSELYDNPERSATHALKPFDPVLQLSQLLAYIGYAGDDTLLSLRLAAHGPGDTDTLAAVLGLIAGARLGHNALMRSEAGDAMQRVEQSTEALFDRDLNTRVDALRSASATTGPG